MARLLGKVVVAVSVVNNFIHGASAFCMPAAPYSEKEFKRLYKKYENVPESLRPWTVSVELAREEFRGLRPVRKLNLKKRTRVYKRSKNIYDAFKKQKAKEGEEQRQEHENIEEPEPEKKQEGESQQDVDADPANENEVLAGKEEEKIEDPSQGAQQNANRESKDEAKVTEVGGSDTESTGTPSNMSEKNQKDAAPEVDDSDAETTVSSGALSTPSNTAEANQKEAASSSLKRFRNRDTRRRNKKQEGAWIDGHWVEGQWVKGDWVKGEWVRLSPKQLKFLEDHGEWFNC